MAAIGMGQKRSRSDLEEDCDDCLPISKRINRLHIKPTRLSEDDDPAKQAPCGECSTQTRECLSGETYWPVNNIQTQQSPIDMLTYRQVDGSGSQHMENNNNIPVCSSEVPGQVASDGMDDVMVYDPELDESENPFYFHSNHLLFNAHVSRTTRTKSFPDS
ncbi:uncharacterized protein LOC121379128 [Gigantopelta aegis]|uniref:uncharacterized protein LOC121379128 n=1 Tax=Gigantopelta aegis TaxID=1735272 RepID=UPI001B88E4B2|nr:uncharacterized protein LOC121379128 [Gigantopelta aegis]